MYFRDSHPRIYRIGAKEAEDVLAKLDITQKLFRAQADKRYFGILKGAIWRGFYGVGSLGSVLATIILTLRATKLELHKGEDALYACHTANMTSIKTQGKLTQSLILTRRRLITAISIGFCIRAFEITKPCNYIQFEFLVQTIRYILMMDTQVDFSGIKRLVIDDDITPFSAAMLCYALTENLDVELIIFPGQANNENSRRFQVLFKELVPAGKAEKLKRQTEFLEPLYKRAEKRPSYNDSHIHFALSSFYHKNPLRVASSIKRVAIRVEKKYGRKLVLSEHPYYKVPFKTLFLSSFEFISTEASLNLHDKIKFLICGNTSAGLLYLDLGIPVLCIRDADEYPEDSYKYVENGLFAVASSVELPDEDKVIEFYTREKWAYIDRYLENS